MALDRAYREGVVMVSLETLDEVRGVLSRERIRRYVKDQPIETFLLALTRETQLVDVTIEIAACRDPKDDKFLSLAISGGATHIITGDQDLLALDPFQGIRIVTPQDFLAFP